MKRLSLTLGAMLCMGCYHTVIDGDAALCREECHDSDPCTEDFCDIDDNCRHVPIPDCGAECASDLDCDDGVDCTVDFCDDGACRQIDECADCYSALDCDDSDDCTLDYCDSGACWHADICPEPVCDPEIRTMDLPALGCSLTAVSDGDIIFLHWFGCGSDAENHFTRFDPPDPPEPLFTYPLDAAIEETMNRPFLFWNGGLARLFWTRKTADDSVIVTAQYDPWTGGPFGIEEIRTDEIPYPAELNDVSQHPSGDYGLGFVMDEPEFNIAWFGRWSPEDGFHNPSRLSSTESRSPVLTATEDGWALAFITQSEERHMVQMYEMDLGGTAPYLGTLAFEPTVFTTRAVVNAAGVPMAFYERYMTADINQLLAGWVLEDDSSVSLDIHWIVAGVAGLDSFNDEPARVSWCSNDSYTGNSSVHVGRISPSLYETELWADLGNAGCSDTDLVRHGDQIYVLWLTEDGLSYKNLSCH